MFRKQRARGKRALQPLRSRRNKVSATNKESLVALLNWFFPGDAIFAKVKLHGNTTWSPSSLVWLALCWAWSESRNLTDAFTESVGCCQKMLACSPLTTYQGFMGAMTRWTSTFVPLLCRALQERMQEIGGKFWRIDQWIPIAFDGSRSTAPRTKANERSFCAANYGQGKTAKYRRKKSKGMRRKQNEKNRPQPQEPQVWITMMWHMALRLPWMWRLGPSNSSERAHVMDMLKTGNFPKNTLFCGDAGFIGYPLWAAILERGFHFLVRIGANVNLLTQNADYALGKNGLVLCWPKTMRLSRRGPLRLRLVKVRIGKTAIWLLTSVLNSANLTEKQMIRLYRMRWGIEVEFRGLKQTLDRAKLRSRHDQRLLAELDWSILAMAVAELFALKEQLSRPHLRPRRPPDPMKRSLAHTMRALRGCLRNLSRAPEPQRQLRALLRVAVTDHYDRKASKCARYRPRNPDQKPLGDPQLRRISAEETKTLRKLELKLAA
jgi:hypothetical protein